jgi:hypothetical protein
VHKAFKAKLVLQVRKVLPAQMVHKAFKAK